MLLTGAAERGLRGAHAPQVHGGHESTVRCYQLRASCCCVLLQQHPSSFPCSWTAPNLTRPFLCCLLKSSQLFQGTICTRLMSGACASAGQHEQALQLLGQQLHRTQAARAAARSVASLGQKQRCNWLHQEADVWIQMAQVYLAASQVWLSALRTLPTSAARAVAC